MSASASLYDVSVWVALAFATHPHHARAKLEFANADSLNPAAFCRPTQQSFLRIVTTPAVQRIYASGVISNHDAWEKWQMLMALPQVVWLDEPQAIEKIWRKHALLRSASPKVWMDAYLAAFAIGHRISIATLDADFMQFKGLSVNFLLADAKDQSDSS